MLVREYMTHDLVTIGPEARLSDALNVMRAHNVHRLPVVEDNLLTGIVSEKDLLYALPSVDRNISWVEASARAAALPVRQVMQPDVITVCLDCPIEIAAATMADHNIGALPVVNPPESHTLVGIITETDIFKLFVEMLGSRTPGVRSSLEIDNRKGALASLFNRVVEAGGLVVSVSSFRATSPNRIRIILKVADVDQDTMRSLLKPEETVIDLREIQGAP
ncbi:MAG: CBS domain-containing protein [Caldiserica bacterium]|nr:CBS domain-containing protein [Caldisericota bacterium]